MPGKASGAHGVIPLHAESEDGGGGANPADLEGPATVTGSKRRALMVLPLQREDVSRDYPELQLGIRMLRTGVEWIKTKDEGALLDLVKEERVIVRQALGLEPGSDD